MPRGQRSVERLEKKRGAVGDGVLTQIVDGLLELIKLNLAATEPRPSGAVFASSAATAWRSRDIFNSVKMPRAAWSLMRPVAAASQAQFQCCRVVFPRFP